MRNEISNVKPLAGFKSIQEHITEKLQTQKIHISFLIVTFFAFNNLWYPKYLFKFYDNLLI